MRQGQDEPELKLVMWPAFELRKGWLYEPLSRQQGIVMLALFARREVFIEDFREMIWPRAWYRPLHTSKALEGIIWNLRTKLKPFGHKITNRWGVGYSLVRDTEEEADAGSQHGDLRSHPIHGSQD